MVVGAGQMGGGIAQTAAQHGFRTTLYDIDPYAAARAMAAIRKHADRSVEKGRLTSQQKDALFSNLSVTSRLEDSQHADLIIEAAPEKIALKKTLFQTLDLSCKPQTILATNTSSISITEIAAATSRPDRVIGMHFMNPVPVMPLVEMIRGMATSDETCRTVQEVSQQLRKTVVEVQDFPGFVSNRVLMPMINEAVYTVYEGVATPEAVDQVMKLGMNHPMGPLTLADFIGLDTCLAIMETLYQGFGDSKYRPCPLLVKYVKAGWLGRKSGRGFYIYD
jgi:3-hydroxybutyryl-CoA dehydrogenase